MKTKMKSHIFCLLFILLFSVSCRKYEEPIPPSINDNPTISELEDYIRYKQDRRAVFTYQQFDMLLNKLSDDKFIVLPINKFKDSINLKKVLIGFRHDVDCHPFKALEMAKFEQEYNFKTTFYILATAEYYGKISKRGVHRFLCLNELYQKIVALNHEIGIHNDLLTIMIKYRMNPLSFNLAEIDYYQSLGIEINGTSSHGSKIANKTVPNYQIFSDFAIKEYTVYNGQRYALGEHSMCKYGFDYEAYHVDYNKYFSDRGGVWNVPGGFEKVLEELDQSKPGDRIQILVHPVWWGK